jgi:hypothetical protein
MFLYRCSSRLYNLRQASLVVLFQQFRCIVQGGGFPRIVCLWVSFPFEEILELFVSPKVAVASDGFHLVLRFAFDEIWRWSRKVLTVLLRLLVWSEDASMKHGMYCPLHREF